MKKLRRGQKNEIEDGDQLKRSLIKRECYMKKNEHSK